MLLGIVISFGSYYTYRSINAVAIAATRSIYIRLINYPRFAPEIKLKSKELSYISL